MLLLLLSFSCTHRPNIEGKSESTHQELIKVYGNCGMCERRIEKAARSVEGVYTAAWNKETKLLELTFNHEVFNERRLHEAVTLVGHDTEKLKARNQDYESLPKCCLYSRPE